MNDTVELPRLIGDQQFRALLEYLPKVAIQGYDRNRCVIYWNEASTRLYGYTAEQAMGQKLEDLLIPNHMRKQVIQAHTAWMNGGRRIPASEMELKHKSGAPVPVFSQHLKLESEYGEPIMFCVDVDLSHERQAQKNLDFIHQYDELTHFRNRQAFEQALRDQITESQRNGAQVAIVALSLEDFRDLRQVHGYAQADSLLTLVAFRLRRHLHKNDLVARFADDEFVMALPCHDSQAEIIPRLEQILDEFKPHFLVGNHKLQVGASLGISLFPEHGTTTAELLQTADLAKTYATQETPGSYQIFSQQLHQQQLYEHQLAHQLQDALRHHELALYYQPQVDPANGQIRSLEALLRWYPHNGEQAISPAEFIPIAERSNLIHEIGEWVINEACRQQAEWKATTGINPCRIGINLSGRQISRHTVFQTIETAIGNHGLSPEDIGIELTENVLIHAEENTLAGLRSLRNRGMHIAIDDFGTGYSSLSYLKHFPLTAIKIDRNFVQGAHTTLSDHAIMEATVLIGHRLGLAVIAEGVENKPQLDMVKKLRCDRVQGYYFYKPQSSTHTTKLLKA